MLLQVICNKANVKCYIFRCCKYLVIYFLQDELLPSCFYHPCAVDESVAEWQDAAVFFIKPVLQ